MMTNKIRAGFRNAIWLNGLLALSGNAAMAAPVGDIQAQIDRAVAAGAHAHLTLRAPAGQSELIVDAPLRLKPGLELVASPPGLVIRATDDPGQTERARPVVIIEGTPQAPIADVALRGFHLDGHFARAPIVIENAASVTIADGEISGSRGNAIVVNTARDVTIARMVMRFVRLPQTDPAASSADPHEGGAGIWCFACNESHVLDNTLDATAFWQPGPAWDSGNGAVCVPGKNHPGCTLTRFGNRLARALDMVAFYGGARDVIANNRISHGNTAAIYVNLCAKATAEFPARAVGLRVTGNQISDMREHGIDIVGAEQPVFSGNQINEVGGAGIALAQVNAASITDNTIRHAGLAWHPPAAAAQTAAIKLLQLTHDSRIEHNHIDPGRASYAVYFEAGTAGNIVGGATPDMANVTTPGTAGIANPEARGTTNQVWVNGQRIGF